MQNNLKESNYREWFKKASDDEESAHVLLNEKGIPNTICFLAQQAAEKYLKGLLVFRGIHSPKVHDLLELETLLLESDKSINEIHEDLIELNRYYITARYPGDYPEFSLQDAQDAYDAAIRVKEFVLDKIK